MNIYRCLFAGCWLLIAGCGQPDPEAAASGIEGPVVVEMNPSGRAPLTGLIQFATNRPMRATLTISDGEHPDMTVTPVDAFNTEHELMLLGLRPNRTQRVEIGLEDSDGAASVAASFNVTTEALPHWLPAIETRISEPDRMEPGITLLPVFNFRDPNFPFVVGLDAEGDVIWFLDDGFSEPRRMRNGNLLSMSESEHMETLTEMDMLGRTVRTWHASNIQTSVPEGAIPVAADSFHHDVLEMPSGNFLALTTEIRHLDNYPTSYLDDTPRSPRDVVADRVIEFRPGDGTIVREWHMADLYDTERLTHGSIEGTFYDPVYAGVRDDSPPDWTHSNGFFYDAASDSLIVSIRKMSALVRIDLAGNRLDWILGNANGWAPEFAELLLEPDGDVTWTYGQHAPELTPDGTLLVYDNGSYQRAFPGDAGPPVSESYSRAIEFAIDEDSGTVSERWSYGGPGNEHFYSEFVSEADRLPMTGNTLLTNGGQIVDEAGAQSNDFANGRMWVSVNEVTTTATPDKVWEVVIDDPTRAWAAYRAERLPSLYP